MTVPSNAPAIPVSLFAYFPADSDSVPGTQLLDGSNAKLSAPLIVDSKGGGNGEGFTNFLFVPDAPLKEGSGYHLGFPECSSDPRDEPSPRFNVGPQVSLPTVAGSVVGGPLVDARLIDATGFDACIGVVSADEENDIHQGVIKAVAVELKLTPSPELRAFAPLTQFTVFIDGTSARYLSYGRAKTDGNALVVGAVRVNCDSNQAYAKHGDTTPGTHTVSVLAHVAGATSDPPLVTTTITLTCPAPGETLPDSGTPQGSDGDHPDASSGTPKADGSNESSGGGSGCAVSREGSNAWGHVGALFASFALIASARSVFRRRAR